MLKFLFCLALAIVFLLPVTTSAQSRDVFIDGDHGKLAATIQTPDGLTKYPLVMILHGFTANKDEELHTTLANNLEREGIASIRFDFNGHGKSEGRFQDMTVLNEIEDAKKVYEYASKLPGVTSVSIIGHSQGGVVTSMTAGELGTKKVKCIALMAPAATLREDAIRGQLFGNTFNSLDPPEYVEIFNGLRVGGEYFRVARDLPIYETAEKYQGPALMVHGTGDVVVPYTFSLHYKHIYKKGELVLLDRFDHGFTQDVPKVAKIVTDYLVKQLKK